MKILRGYGPGPNLQRLLQSFWGEQWVVPKAGRLYGQPFITEIVVNQWDLFSPTLFNIVVDAVLSVVLLEFFSP